MSFEPAEVNGHMGARFLRMAAEFPDHIAVHANGRDMPYRTLAQKAGAMAHQLLELAGPGWGRVVLCCHDPHTHAAAMLGALLANKSVTVLDRHQPPAHMGRLLDDLAPATVLHDAAWRERAESAVAAQHAGRATLCEATSQEGTAPRLDIAPESIALIVYTSGSSGSQKGVMRDHRMMLQRSRTELDAGNVIYGRSRGTTFGSIAFSAAQNGLLANVLNGGCECIYDFEARGVAGISDWVQTQRLTYVCMMVALARQWVSLDAAESPAPALRRIQLSGAPARVRDAHELQRKLGRHIRVSGTYSSTETATNTRWQGDADAVDRLHGDLLPLGPATPDREILLLDEGLRALPQGATGEIAIRSRFVARGYWRAPDLTAATFLNDPRDPEARIYRTGDFGRLNADGMLEVLGRVDALVKVRGFRVNTNDVAALLLRTPGVRNAAVLARPRADGDHELIAFVQHQPDHPLDAPFLRVIFDRELPRYMHPRHIVMLDELPLLANGKVDAAALSKMNIAAPETPRGKAPRTAAEQMLGALWMAALKSTSVDVHQSFGDAGGDSFAAAVLEILLVKQLGSGAGVEAILRQPTIAHQAIALEQLRAGRGPDASAGAPLLLSAGDAAKPPVFVLPMIDGSISWWRPLAARIDHPIHALRLPLLDTIPPDAGFAQLAPQLADDITRLQPEGPVVLIGACRMGRLALETCAELQRRSRQIGFAGVIDMPIDTRDGRSGRQPTRGAWLALALRTLLRATQVDGPRFAAACVARGLHDVLRRVTHPVSRRHTARQKAYIEATRALGERFVPRAFSFPVWFVKGGWSQFNGVYEGRSRAMGWDAHLADLRVVVVPASHSSMFGEPAVQAFARELRLALASAGSKPVHSGELSI